MSWHYDPSDLSESDTAKITELLVGHKVTKVADDKLTLDDGTVLTIYPNEGCGGCTSGDYGITELNGCDNIITSVSVTSEDKKADYEIETIYRIFVYAENKQINLLTVEGTDGNGYYGTGYAINVLRPTVDV